MKRCQVCNRPIKFGYLCLKHQKSHIVLNDNVIVRKYSKYLSKPEKYILGRLVNANIGRILFEVYFDWAKERPRGVRLPYDIVIMDKKVIIEYDGRQHFEWIPFFHKTKKAFLKAQRRDKIKEQLAKIHGYNVIRISYKDNLDNKIDEIIKEFK